MSDFVFEGSGAVPNGKVDANPLGVPANKGVTATEWNTVMQDLKDLRDGIINGKWHTLQEFAAAVSSVSKGNIRFHNGRFEVSEGAGAYQIMKHPDVNVLSFDADPTGVADSAPAFMAAIASFSNSSSSNAGRIIVPPGTYRFASTVRVKKCVWICGVHAGPGVLIKPDPGICPFKFERYNTSTDLGTGAGDNARLSNVEIYNPSHKVAVFQNNHGYLVGDRFKVGPAPGQGLIPFTDQNEFYRHYECTTAGTSAGTGNGPKSLGQDKLLNYDGQTVNFTVGDYVHGATSGAQGKIIADSDGGATGTLRLTSVSGTFLDNEALTDDHTGAAVANGTQSAAPDFELNGTARFKYIGSGAGVHIRANGVVLQDVVISGMSGAGAHIVAGDLEDPGAFVNANGWQFFNVNISSTDGHGVYLRGSDANGGVYLGGAVSGCGGPSSDNDFTGPGFLVYETSFLGNTFIGVEMYTVGGQGAIFHTSIGGGASFIGCYQEGSGGGHSISTTALSLFGGGVADHDWKSSGYATGSVVWNPGVVMRLGTSGTYGIRHNINCLTAPLWRASVTIPKGITRQNGGHIYIATTQGITASSGGPTGTGTGITDGSVVWDYVGEAELGNGFVQHGSPDPQYRVVQSAQVPEDVSLGLSWQDMHESVSGQWKSARIQRYGISGPSPSDVDGNGIGLMIAQNQTIDGVSVTKIPAGRAGFQEVWIGSERIGTTDTAADPTYGTWNPGDRLLYRSTAVVAGGAQGRRCVTGGTAKTYSGGRTATATGTNVINLTGAIMGSLRDQQEFKVGDYITVGGSAVRRVTLVSADGRTLTLNGTIGAASGLAMAFVLPVFEEFGVAPAPAFTAVGASPNNNGASVSGQTITLQPADATHPGVLSAADKVKLNNTSNSNSGDVTLAAVGSSPSANGASLSGQVLTLQPADATHPGAVALAAQTMGSGLKTFPDGANLQKASNQVAAAIPVSQVLGFGGAAVGETASSSSGWTIGATASGFNFYFGNQLRFSLDNNTGVVTSGANSAMHFSTPAKVLAGAGLGVGNSASASAVGTLTKKMEVFDASGTSLGFVPIYATIT